MPDHSPQEAAQLIRDARIQKRDIPPELHGTLSMEEAYRVQQALLALHVGAGSRQAGWKAGLTAQVLRDQFNSNSAVFGHLLEENRQDNHFVFAYGDMAKPALECELCIVMGEPLAGPGVTPEQAARAVGAVIPAFEIIELRVNMGEDLPLGVADNVMQWGWLTGEAIQPPPEDLDLPSLRVEIIRNREVALEAIGRDAIDNQFETLAWLANSLAEYGHTLEAGQRILTGSFNKPIPIEQGDVWEAHFHGLGRVMARFA